MKRKVISILMVLVFLITLVTSPLSTTYASKLDKSPSIFDSAQTTILDFSFFNLDPGAAEYSEGAGYFLDDCSYLISVLKGADFGGNGNIDKTRFYITTAEALKYSEICKYLNDPKYADPLKNYNMQRNKSTYIFEDIINFEENLKKAFVDKIIPHINELFSEASKIDKLHIVEAIEIYNDAIDICDSVLLNLPNYQLAKDKKAEIQNTINTLIKTLDSSFCTSDVQKNNLGKIVFSTKNIVAGKETSSQFSSNYTSKSNIYAIAYLPMKIKSFVPTISSNGTYYRYQTVSAKARYYIDGVASQYEDLELPVNIQEYQGNKAYITFDIIPNINKITGNSILRGFLGKSGKHVIRIDLRLNNIKVAEGKFEIDWNKADTDKVYKNISQCEVKAEEYRANQTKLPVQFSQKHKKYKDTLLSDEKIKALFMDRYSNNTKIIKFISVGENKDSWTIDKDELNKPKSKSSTMDTWVLYKAENGWYYFTQIKVKCNFNKETGKYMEPQISSIMVPTRIASKNVK